MSTRLNITISDDLNNELDKAVAESETNKSEIFRKALTLYLAMYEGRKNGRKVGLVDPETQMLETEIIGL
ncbi:MAG: ribbon-helix-helix protein, CopG family [Methylococcaceae bacterium]|nr:ribbon-helix-helix protein, CopG family [Methylococcaceae bacterium]